MLDSMRTAFDAAPRAASPAVCARLDLLTVKARDKAYLPITDDSLMMAAYDYYTMQAPSAVLRRHKPELCYYMGRTRFELGDYPRALDFFQQSLAAITAAHADSLRLRSQVYSNMGAIYRLLGAKDDALDCTKKALDCDICLADTLFLVNDYGTLSDIYCETNYDSAMYYLNKSLDLASSVGDSIEIRIAQCHIGITKILNGKWDETADYLQYLTSPAFNDKSASYLYVGILYQHMGEDTSAEEYFRKTLADGTIYARQTAYRHLADIMNRRRQTDKTLQYVDSLVAIADSVVRIKDVNAIRRMQAAYNYGLKEKEIARLNVEQEKIKRNYTIILYTSVLLLTLAAGYIAVLRHRRKAAELKCRQFEALVHSLTQRDAETHSPSSELTDKRLRLISKAKQGERYCKADWQIVAEYTDATSPDFRNKLITLCDISDIEMQVCCLMKMGLPYVDIASATGRSKSAITHIRERLIMKCSGSKRPAADWDALIESLSLSFR